MPEKLIDISVEVIEKWIPDPPETCWPSTACVRLVEVQFPTGQLLPVSEAVVVVVLRGGAVVAGAPVVDDPEVGFVLEEAELASVVPLLRLAFADPHAAVSAPAPKAPATKAARRNRRASRTVVKDIDVHLATARR